MFKMRWIYSLVFLIYVVHAEEVDKVEPSAVQNFFQKRCYSNAKEGDAYDQLVYLSFVFYKYAEYTASFFPRHIDHFCNSEKPILKNKLSDVNKQMLRCLPQDEKFLSQFIEDSFQGFMEFLCVNGSTNAKSFFSTHGKECRVALSRNNSTQEVGECFSKFFLSVNDKGYMTKETMCRDIGIVKGCFIGVLDKSCPNFAAFQELNKRFFEYINKPCSAGIFGVNNE